MRTSQPVPTSTPEPMSSATVVTLALLSASAPLATDMYLPGFPHLVAELSASAAAVQLTLTTYLIGLAIGQLIIGPLSDQWGRRNLLVGGTILAAIAGIGCALAPNIASLVVLRFLQGIGGAAGIVLSRAVISDRASGTTAAQLFGVLAIVQAVSSVVAPPLGGALVESTGWRGILWILAAFTLLMLIGIFGSIPESLPIQDRHAGGLQNLMWGAHAVLKNPRYLGFTLTFALSFAALFAFIAASPFVLQSILGLSPVLYSAAFGVNALGLVAASTASTILVKHIGSRKLLATGLIVLLTATSLLFLAIFVAGIPLWPTLLLTFLVMASMGFILGNATSLATAEVPFAAGAGSAILGALQFGLGALVSPLVGLAGERDARPMAITMLVATGCAVAAFLALGRKTVEQQPFEDPPPANRFD